MASDITFIGETTFRNTRRKFGIKIDDRRRHFYAVGKTGMGKTAMLENMAIQDIQNGLLIRTEMRPKDYFFLFPQIVSTILFTLIRLIWIFRSPSISWNKLMWNIGTLLPEA
jgi:hypothetical protein